MNPTQNTKRSEVVTKIRNRIRDSIMWAVFSLTQSFNATLFFLTIIFLFSIPVYEKIPQAFGGGKPLIVQFSMDADKIPPRIRLNEYVSQTVKLNLIFQTENEYIVSQGDTDIWIIKTENVIAILIKND